MSRARVLAAVVVLGFATLATSMPASSAGSDPQLTDSAVTTQGTGRFSDLAVTVGKTAHLGNEAVKVSWKWGGADPGSRATYNDTQWHYNYLSIFQCWGDQAQGPKREQCQYGGQFGETDGVNTKLNPFFSDASKRFAVSRVVSPKDVFGHPITQATDPLEATSPEGYPSTATAPGIVAMHSAPTSDHPEGEVVTAAETGQFFDKYGTNEVPLARTNADGSGEVFFEAQTVYESQFLGCGSRVRTSSGVDGRGCFLVVVPRDTTDANGDDVTQRDFASTRSLYSSPLALSNWSQRIVVPLAFDPVREACAIGGVERPVVGHESVSVAISSWQVPLCAAGQGFFYATTTDDIARTTVNSDLPKLSIVTDPLPPQAIPPNQGKAIYAPVALSGVSISLFVEREYNSASDPALRRYNGTRVERLNLTPRLVAKLLTESYRYSTWINNGGPEHLAGAPQSIIDDPDFAAINANKDLADDVVALRNQRESLAKLFVSPDASDAVRLLWTWILGDTEARDFLSGKPDPWGMKVNKYYEGLDRYSVDGAARNDIPKLEEDCVAVAVGSDSGSGSRTQNLCALDAAPYVSNFEQAATLTARGQQVGGGSFVFDAACSCVKIPRPEPQLVGARALLALTDTPSSARRGLVPAALRNASGSFVTPTPEAMLAALASARPTAVAGVNRIDPTKVQDAGFPLTRLSYAVTNAAKLDAEARKDYADFVSLVTSTGQVPGSDPGSLPVGYAPLPVAYQAQAKQAAATIRTATLPSAPATTPRPSAAPTPADEVPAPSALPEAGAPPARVGGVPDSTPVAGPVAAVPVAGAVTPGAAPPVAAGTTVLPTGRTALIAATFGTWMLPLLAGIGLVAGFGGRLATYLAIRGARAP